MSHQPIKLTAAQELTLRQTAAGNVSYRPALVGVAPSQRTGFQFKRFERKPYGSMFTRCTKSAQRLFELELITVADVREPGPAQITSAGQQWLAENGG